MKEEKIAEEEKRKRFDPIRARAREEMQRRMKERREEEQVSSEVPGTYEGGGNKRR